MSRRLADPTATALERETRDRQRSGRVPGLIAGTAEAGSLTWQLGVGAAHVEHPDTPPGPDDQFLIASNTKTFTAVMVMQLRDEGRLTLDDPLDRHVAEVTQGGITVRSMLAHASGVQREPAGDVWETLVNPDRDELIAGFNEAERVGAPHHVFHYSNLAFSMLGELVARLDGRSWAESLQARLLDPLGMTRTSVGLRGRAVQGYYVPPYSDVVTPEPVLDLKALAPCGGLASTAADMAIWSGFVADPPAEILSPDTLEEMLQPQIMTDVVRWNGAFGLGFMLIRSGTRIYAGHTGGMPGHITGMFTDPESGVGALVLMNSTSAPDPAAFAIALADRVVQDDPPPAQPWRPGTAVPDELRGTLGLWYSEGAAFVFSVEAGVLQARAQTAAEHVPPAVFERLDTDLYRTVSGRERGEVLRLTRDADGYVTKMNWATYLVTREPLAFGEWL